MKNKLNYNIVQQLGGNKSKDPKTYWKVIKGDQSNTENGIALHNFYDHFRLLFTDDDRACNEGIDYGITTDSNSPILNDPITYAEIKICIRKPKSNKSPGVDNIINEYTKCTKDLLRSLC